ncbi:hypothetical protein F5Y13DRAFT_197938 [Hypoxylon sp. FL1857]|nr:hypothetical protein F5Y13DRAFT_197938 [Hypoxylon sp. FL1857]
MSRLESLAPELRDLIIDQCDPGTLLGLISASPTYLRNFNAGRARIIRRYVHAAQAVFPPCLIKEAVTLVIMRVRRRAWIHMAPATVVPLVLAYLKDAVGESRSRLAYLHHPRWDNLRFLGRALELAAEIEAIDALVAPRVRELLRRWRGPGRYGLTHAPGSTVSSESQSQALGIRRAVLMYELFAASIVFGLRDDEDSRRFRDFWEYWEYWAGPPDEQGMFWVADRDVERRVEFNAVSRVRRSLAQGRSEMW